MNNKNPKFHLFSKKDLQLGRSLLLALCRRNAIEGLDPVLVEPLADHAFRREFLEIASAHRVMGLALSIAVPALARSGGAGRGNQELGDLLRTARRRAAMFEIQRDHVVAILLSAGVQPVILKGAAIAMTFYDKPFERDFVDLDILVPEDQVEQSLQALGAQGYVGPTSPEVLLAYRHYHFHVPLRDRLAHVVEIHWRLTRASELFQLDANEVLSQSTSLERSGPPVLVLPRPEHTLLHLVIQNLHEGFSRLSRLVDMDRIVAATPGLDWDALIATARKGNLAPATAVSLQLANRLLGCTVPEDVLRELRPGAVARFHLAIMRPVRSMLTQRLPSAYATKRLQELWLVRGARKRILLLSQMLSSDAAVTFPRKERRGALRRFWILGKLVVLQVCLYGVAVAAQATRVGRVRMRFW